MFTTLDLLDAKMRETFAYLREDEQAHLSSDALAARLEQQTKTLYRWVIQQSKAEMSVPEVYELWDTMAVTCDFFINHIREMVMDAPHPASFDGLLDLRLACDEKREFHRCN